MGALVLHGIGRIVFGARDAAGGAGAMLSQLPKYYQDGATIPLLIGPLLPELCDPLYERVNAGFDNLPCGKLYRP
jgi:tRNA(Arg) A34 adenosine deaminase TadA